MLQNLIKLDFPDSLRVFQGQKSTMVIYIDKFSGSGLDHFNQRF